MTGLVGFRTVGSALVTVVTVLAGTARRTTISPFPLRLLFLLAVVVTVVMVRNSDGRMQSGRLGRSGSLISSVGPGKILATASTVSSRSAGGPSITTAVSTAGIAADTFRLCCPYLVQWALVFSSATMPLACQPCLMMRCRLMARIATNTLLQLGQRTAVAVVPAAPSRTDFLAVCLVLAMLTARWSDRNCGPTMPVRFIHAGSKQLRMHCASYTSRTGLSGLPTDGLPSRSRSTHLRMLGSRNLLTLCGTAQIACSYV